MVFALLAAVNLTAGFSTVGASAYRSEAQIVGEFMGSPIRLLFPIAVAIIAGPALASELNHRYIASTRPREDIRSSLTRKLGRISVVLFLVFSGLAAINVLAGFYVAPAIWPKSIDPAGFELADPTAITAAVEAMAPLTRLLTVGPLAYLIGCAVWMGAQAVLFGFVTFIAVLLIRRSVLALAIPLGVYLVESIMFQVLSLPGLAFMSSTVYPDGLERFSISQAIAPAIVLGAGSIIAAACLVLTARTNPRFA